MDVWLLHDSGRTVPEIARELSMREDDVRAVIAEIWSEDVGKWKGMMGLGPSR